MTRVASIVKGTYAIVRDVAIGTATSYVAGEISAVAAAKIGLNAVRARKLGSFFGGLAYSLAVHRGDSGSIVLINAGSRALDSAANSDWGFFGATAAAIELAYNVRHGTPLFGSAALQTELSGIAARYGIDQTHINSKFTSHMVNCLKLLE